VAKFVIRVTDPDQFKPFRHFMGTSGNTKTGHSARGDPLITLAALPVTQRRQSPQSKRSFVNQGRTVSKDSALDKTAVLEEIAERQIELLNGRTILGNSASNYSRASLLRCAIASARAVYL
jgi:hypothetical protein